VLQEDAKELVIEQAEAEPALLTLADVDAPIAWALPIAVEG
jgi:hypothetical protein